MTTITAEAFKAAMGHDPTDDDLERCNCRKAGTPGHWSCGWCAHNKPVFMCSVCMQLPPFYRDKPKP